MSYTEMHTGSLREVETLFTVEELMSFLRSNEDLYVDDLEEKIEDGHHYFEIYNRNNRKLEYIMHNEMLFEVLNHYKTDEADYLLDVKKGEDDLINFNLIFYNGGTCFSEMLEEGLSKL